MERRRDGDRLMSLLDTSHRAERVADEREFRSRAIGRSLAPRTVIMLGLLMLMAGILVVREWRPAAGAPPSFPTSPQIENAFGVRFTSVDITAAGGMIQLRYQVLDSAKTAVVHDKNTAPFVVDHHGKKYADPGMVGHTHVGPLKAAGSSDYILLANSGGGVHHGDLVTIKFGAYELRRVPVL
jgi:hypothetical protein